MFIQQIFLITTAPFLRSTRYCCNKLRGFLSSLSPQSSNSRELKETDYEPREYCLYLSTSSLWSLSLLWLCQLPGSASPFKYWLPTIAATIYIMFSQRQSLEFRAIQCSSQSSSALERTSTLAINTKRQNLDFKPMGSVTWQRFGPVEKRTEAQKTQCIDP